ncbi:MAG: hypothetical protein ACLGXA_18135 [Acidobacteriota bacterium]
MSPAWGEGSSVPLQPGDALPSLAGQTLSNRSLHLPAAASGEVAVVIFSFSRAGGHEARNWALHLSKDYPRLKIYNAIFLESVPRLFRGMVVSGIRSGMPPSVQDRTVILYQQQNSWEQKLHLADENSAVVLVLGRTGLIRYLVSGTFAEAIYARVREEVGP